MNFNQRESFKVAASVNNSSDRKFDTELFDTIY